MAFSNALLASSFLCVPLQTPNRPLLGAQRPHSLVSKTTSSSSMMLPRVEARGKSQYQPLKSSNKRSSGKVVKAMSTTPDLEAPRYTKNVEVFSGEHLLDSLAHDIIRLSQQCIEEKGFFSFAVADTTSVRLLRLVHYALN